MSTAARIHPGEPLTIGWPLRGWEVSVARRGRRTGAARRTGRARDRRRRPRPLSRRGARPPSGSPRCRRSAGIARYRTGDIVRETVHGLQFIGRRDDQVKIAGRRVELGEIDARLSAIPGVKAAASAVRESSAQNKLLVAYVVGEAEPSAIRAHLAERLPAGLMPLIVVARLAPARRLGQGRPQGAAVATAGGAQVQRAVGHRRVAGRSLERAARPAAAELRQRLLRARRDLARGRQARLGCTRQGSRPSPWPTSIATGASGSSANGWTTSAPPRSVPPTSALRRAGAGDCCSSPGSSLLKIAATPPWLLGVLALNRLVPGQLGPQVGWGWLIAGWFVFASIPGRAMLLALSRRLLLGGSRRAASRATAGWPFESGWSSG